MPWCDTDAMAAHLAAVDPGAHAVLIVDQAGWHLKAVIIIPEWLSNRIFKSYVEAFKKNFPAELAKIRARLPKGVEIELWWRAPHRPEE